MSATTVSAATSSGAIFPGSSVGSPSGMYLVLPVPFREIDGKLHIEAQAANGLDRWAENFSTLTVSAPLIPEAAAAGLAGFVWRAVDTLEHIDRITCLPLPWAYSLGTFVKNWRETRAKMAASIKAAQYLQFAICGLVGDWAAVAALEAIRQRRRYAVHTDRVEHELIKKISKDQTGQRWIKTMVEVSLMERSHRHVIEHASLGLWHGDDCFRGYSPWCSGQNHLIHDVHTKQADQIDEAALEKKLAEVRTSEELRICYAGRLDPMKAPLEWLRALAAARAMGARVRATWFGEGPLLEEAKAEAIRLNLTEVVTYPGFVAGRAALLSEIRSAHVMVFTHVTPESPRNLLESLVSGTPIVGYDIPYAADLLAAKGGGLLAPMHDVQAVGALIADLDQDREKLAALIEQAAENGRRFTDTAVFAERSELVRRFA